MHRLLLVVLLFQVCGRTQEIADVLPPGMRLAADGKLEWNVPPAATCRACAGNKSVACPRCDGKPEPCGLCRERRVPCRSCGATGKELDPFVEMVCPGCSGTQRDVCPTCDGTNSIVAPDGRASPCGGCKGARTFPCVDCGGSGRLAFPRLAGKDLRAAGLSQAMARRGELVACGKRVQAAEQLRSAEPLREMGILLDEVRLVLDLPSGQAERLAALVAAAVGEDAEFEREHAIGHRALTIERRIEAERTALDTCIWRHRRNAGEFDKPGETQLASAIQWQFPFGEDTARPDVLWLLLGRGFFRAPTAKDAGDVAAAWLQAHPRAVLRPVARMEGGGARGPALWVQVWVVDGEAELGVHLVAKGSVPARTLWALRPEIEVPFADYLAFVRRAQVAEDAAKAQKLGLWQQEDPARDAHLEAAAKLRREGRHREAIGEYEAALAAGADKRDACEQLGNCQLALGEHAAALTSFEQAIAAGATYEAWRGKARCLWRLRGQAEAIAFVRSLQPALELHDIERWVGELCERMGEADLAIEHYERSIDLVVKEHAFRFDAEGWLQVDAAVLAKENNDFADLWPTLEDVAALHLRAGADGKALRFATMAVAIGQQLNRCKGYYNATEVTAGSVEGRVLRGRVFCRLRRLDDAATEERLARALAQRSGYSGYFEKLKVLVEEIEKGRRR